MEQKLDRSPTILVIVLTVWPVAVPVAALNAQQYSQPTKQPEAESKPAEPKKPETTAQEPEKPEPEAPKPETPPAKALPGPKYFQLRYLEDWSYLDGPAGSYEPDIFDPIKNIDLGGDWRLDLGGSVRLRLMSETNKTYSNIGRHRETQDTYLLQQYLLHANLHYQDILRLFVQGIHAQADGRQTPALNIDENFYDFNQAFLDVKPLGEGTPLILRFGRQEILLGNQRLVSPLAWANTRRRFDGADLLWRSDTWNLDAFYVRPVPVVRFEGLDRKLDEYEEHQHFFGLYSTYKGLAGQGLDLYYLVLLNNDPPPNSAGIADHLTVHTLGTRWWGAQGPWDYEFEGAIQLGHYGGDEVFAWMIALDGGYTFEDWPLTPRLGIGFDWATGDHDPGDSQHNTFNQLFPLAHKYFGILDEVARQNIIDPHISLTLKPLKSVSLMMAYHQFFLDQSKDALYNAAGVPVRRDRSGRSGNAVGGELDIVTTWNINRHQSLQFGWAHLWPGSFIDQTGDNDDADLIYLQYIFRF